MNEVNGLTVDEGAAARRPTSPKHLLRPQLARQIYAATPGLVWDLMLASELADVLDPKLSRLAINDWEYQRTPLRPPLEPRGRWATGPGAPRVIRKDRAMLWAMTRGRGGAASEDWRLTRWELLRLGMPVPANATVVREQVQWLLNTGCCTLRFPARQDGDDDRFFG